MICCLYINHSENAVSDLDFDRNHLWHPYTTMPDTNPVYEVDSADGVRLCLSDGRELIDGMSSWWAAIHGYNHPVLNTAINKQIEKMSHVMFGGLTHEPAVTLGCKLIDLTPEPLDKIFFADSGSVSVEVAIKMAIQYWQAKGTSSKNKLLSFRGGYHGDTFGAMALCDPVNGMHHLFQSILAKNIFAPRPGCKFDENWDHNCLDEFTQLIEKHHNEIAAIIIEPIVQGAGGMYFYHPLFLNEVRKISEDFGILLIADEIATGFGRTGKFWGCDHAGISPDIMCVGKAITGGYMTLAATIATTEVAETISSGDPGLFMHGPTFMGNPLACAVASASIDLLSNSLWQEQVKIIETILLDELSPCKANPMVADVRVLGAIGVVEMKKLVDIAAMQQQFVDNGVWVRPFGKLVYVMPPYIISKEDLLHLCQVIVTIIASENY